MRGTVISLRRSLAKTAASLWLFGFFIPFSATQAQTPTEPERELEEVRVVAPLTATTLPDSLNSPHTLQTFTAQQLADPTDYSLLGLLESQAANVTSNAAQGNRLQPDLQYRGFTASPLLGLSQGLAVYQNGVRVNEIFGDTVNWDLLPAGTTERMVLLGGAHPALGLNAVGGTLAVQTKTGFSHPGGDVAVTLGDFDTTDVRVTAGQHGRHHGWMLGAESMEESGWRDHSDSSVDSLYTAYSWRGEDSQLDVFGQLADTDLRGNGAVPVALLAASRSAVFTHPDRTQNRLKSLSASFQHAFSRATLSVNAFYRDLEVRTFNGDGAVYEECSEDEGVHAADLDAEEHADSQYEGLLCREEGVLALDTAGQVVDEDYNAVNNRSRRDQRSYGATIQWSQVWDAGGQHNATVGTDYLNGDSRFASSTEFSQLTADRGTTLTSRYDADGFTTLNTDIESLGVFLATASYWSDRFSSSASARYQHHRSDSLDPTGARPALAGDHTFEVLSLGLGASWLLNPDTALYASARSGARIPTPVELACSHPEAPCTLPNSFLADPPLEKVKSLSIEAGLRGQSAWLSAYRISVFQIESDDDIVFQTTGGVSSNQGFFQNASDTRRAGLELELHIDRERWSAYLNYSRLSATFEDAFYASSPNHPRSVDGKLLVESGARIPLLPRDNVKLGLTYGITDGLTAGFDARYQSGVHLRGDEANVDARTDDWAVLDLYLAVKLPGGWSLEARLDNALDHEYETFGLYGEPDEVMPELDDDDTRFFGPGMPRTWWITLGYQW